MIVDPKDPDRAFVAVLGHPYGANPERGVFRTTNGGKTWEKVLYKDENTGAVALAFDPSDAQTVYAVLWAARQGPWENGAWQGPGSGLFKSTDGGTTWKQLTKGLPTAAEGLGRIGLDVSRGPIRSGFTRWWMRPRAGGLYRSDDAGDIWRRVNGDRRVWGRGDDFAEVKIDPKNKDVIYVANIALQINRRRQVVHVHQGLTRRRRLSHDLDQPGRYEHHPAGRGRPGRGRHGQRRRDVESLVQPADRPVLPRHHR